MLPERTAVTASASVSLSSAPASARYATTSSVVRRPHFRMWETTAPLLPLGERGRGGILENWMFVPQLIVLRVPDQFVARTGVVTPRCERCGAGLCVSVRCGQPPGHDSAQPVVPDPGEQPQTVIFVEVRPPVIGGRVPEQPGGQVSFEREAVPSREAIKLRGRHCLQEQVERDSDARVHPAGVRCRDFRSESRCKRVQEKVEHPHLEQPLPALKQFYVDPQPVGATKPGEEEVVRPLRARARMAAKMVERKK